MIKKIINLISIFKRKIKYRKTSYSYNGIDLIIEYLFKDKNNGFYVDAGCQHPISNNNTYLLFKKGWTGINVDLDKKNIDLFKISRPFDLNLNYALSNVIGETELYYYHDSSPINTLSYKVSNYQNAKIKEIRRIKTTTLNNIFSNIKLTKKIDYMSIDVEGYENLVLQGFDINKYKPSVISIEYLDLKMKKLKLKNNDIHQLLNSNLYKHFINNNYYFINWLHGDLVFVHKDFRD